ncbi:MAG: YitT family protein [Desulfosarcinaceae bacterium]|nr:YitT family protein [Desulfosarcinaceae bacterium]
MMTAYRNLISSIAWNLALLTLGAFIFAVGVTTFAIPQGLIMGGFSGVGLLLYYLTDLFSPGIWYFLVNLPVMLAGWLIVSRRFIFYSLYGMLILSVALDTVVIPLAVTDPFLAILAGGTIMGFGAGISLHSLGSMGGVDIIAIVLNQKLGMRIGTVSLVFNFLLFSLSFGILELEPILYSLALTFIIAQVMDYVLSMFNQRKLVLIISERSEEIAVLVRERLQRGATFLNGSGAYTGRAKKILLTVVNPYQLKRLEEIAFKADEDAFMITENTFNVLGRGFSKRKVY